MPVQKNIAGRIDPPACYARIVMILCALPPEVCVVLQYEDQAPDQ